MFSVFANSNLGMGNDYSESWLKGLVAMPLMKTT